MILLGREKLNWASVSIRLACGLFVGGIVLIANV